MDKIVIKNARENNLKGIDLELPKNKLIVMSGVSGSGKSSLAFDTIYAEGQRRYVESLSAYARQFLGSSNKADVDSIEGLSPSISIDQKSTNKNPRSTVGTITEIYDYLRLLYARIGVPYCPKHGIAVSEQSVEEMTNKILEYEIGTKIEICSPVVHGEKGTFKDKLDEFRKDGFVRALVDGEVVDLNDDIVLEKNKKHTIHLVIDRLIIKEDSRSRIFEAIESATKLANGKVVIKINGEKEVVFSENYACPMCDFSIPELEPRLFSFNSPYGACPECKGLGVSMHIDEDILIPDKTKSIMEGAVVSFQSGETLNIYFKKLDLVAKHYNIDLYKPVKDLTREELDIILYRSPDMLDLTLTTRSGSTLKSFDYFEGIITNLERRYIETTSSQIREWIERYMTELPCSCCHGARLKDEVLSVKVGKLNIYEITNLSIRDLLVFFDKLKLTKEQEEISHLIIKEIKERLNFLKNVGLEYLNLSRSAGTLSGGEAQRIRLATQIGSRLSGILYVLDEPSIGLHQRDNEKLINSLKEMRDIGNTLIVVEHDTDTILAADYVVDIGPHAGRDGGHLVFAGTVDELKKCDKSITGRYLSGKEKIEIPKKRRKGNGKSIKITGCSENNLKNINVEFPLGKFICVTGVSGSGKSTLVNEILGKTLTSTIYSSKDKPGQYKSIKGLENVDKVVNITQDPIGRTPRSNPATYVGVFDAIRDVFAETREAKIRGYDKGRFSFNVKGGRCEACWGDGVKKIEMHFLPDVYVPCDVCNATRYNKETLKVKFKGLNIAEVLDLRVDEAIEIFENVPKVYKSLKIMQEVGLGYVKLGQTAPTLSGGEASRVKLAKELQKKPTGKSIFILDEPSTGLHQDDIKKLLVILNRIVDNGDTVIVIEHNLDIIATADHIIDLGPEGGDFGGTIVAKGTPEEVAKVKESYTGHYLKNILK